MCKSGNDVIVMVRRLFELFGRFWLASGSYMGGEKGCGTWRVYFMY